MKLEFDLAKTLLFQNKDRQIATLRLKTAVFGIFLACFGLFVGASLIAGYHDTFVRAILAFSAHVTVKPYQNYLTSAEVANLEHLLQEESVTTPLEYSKFLIWEGLVPTDEGFQAVAIKGVEFAKLKTLYNFAYDDNPQFSGEETSGIYLGKNLLLQNPKIQNGRMGLLYLKNGKLAQSVFSIRGSFQSGIEPYDSEFVFMDLGTLQARLVQDPENPVLGIEIRLKNFSQIETLTARLRERLGLDWQVIPWNEGNFSLLDGLKLEKTTFTAIGFGILLVAALNIFGFNLMFFLQNKNTFRVLLMLGYSPRRLRAMLRSVSLVLAVGSAVLAAICAAVVTLVLNAGGGFILELPGWPPIPLLARWSWGLVWAFFMGASALSLFTSELAARSILSRKN